MVTDHPGPTPPDTVAAPTGWARWIEILLPVALVIAGIVILVETQNIRVVRAMAQVSPRRIPEIIGTALIVVGIWYAIDIIRKPHVIAGGEDAEDVDLDAPTDFLTLAIIGVALVVFALLVERAGFVIASAVLFLIASTAMGSRRLILNALIGLVLGIVIFLVFDTWLGVRLPEGWLVDILP